ncbi:helix-turn-helix domain-containing protein [Micromonospora fluostatini]|uniref:helix-turn-helix domain-containing protein n=1 Tax=Micromonospora sp. JCM 30529 TaxID=3421643 RepID=UPI003D179F50
MQALAYELRKLRTEAGNPTYRALARTAGYSATTLSEAAGGTRLPTLEVVLAYTGACGGDPDRWRARWHEAARTAQAAARTASAGAAGSPTDQQSPAPPAPPTPPAPAEATEPGPPGRTAPPPAPPEQPVTGAGAGRRTRWRQVLLTVVPAGVAVVAATAFGLAVQRAGPLAVDPSTGAGPRCPGLPADARFTGTTYGSGAHVRTGATRDDAVTTTIPPDCTVGFTGFCVGEKVYDNTGGTPDVRWFMVPGGGVVSSAVIHGNPPRELPATDCPNGRPTPSVLDFSVVAESGGALSLRVTGADLDVVGFTASTGPTTSSGGPAWRQVTLADVRDPGVGARARFEPATTTAPAGGPLVLVAAACLGGDSPTGLVRALRVQPGGSARPAPVTLDPGQRAQAAASACRYPRAG